MDKSCHVDPSNLWPASWGGIVRPEIPKQDLVVAAVSWKLCQTDTVTENIEAVIYYSL